ncbi:legumain-like [Oppia nitens]|uniref:legumain-like n=1 Tax=Oppia nitens TaxID=1686743 RepID=UPI0023D9DD4F|nr:legumain-like [Oppia nitens]
MKVIALLAVLFSLTNAFPFESNSNGTTWVVLVAGSNGWYNYRHQADVYHAYQVVRNHGIPEKNIIVFHYDDIAHHSSNPTPGQVINKPGGTDVYHEVPKDFIGKDVTPKNFLAVLKGDQELAKSGKKVLKSGANDNVFVFFSDHGSTDLIAFPNEYLYGEDLNKALQYMFDHKMYSKLVFYLEACESGSMFNKLLPKNINVYATTASNPTESSYACYYDAKRSTYLGDVYSVNWVEDSDRRDVGKETLVDQFNVVKQRTTTSHVQQYGDLVINQLTLKEFQGDKVAPPMDKLVVPVTDAVDSGDVPLEILKHRVDEAQSDTQKLIFKEQLQRLKDGRQFLTDHLRQYVNSIKHLVGDDIDAIMNTKQELNNRQCYRQLVDIFNQKALNLNQHPYVLRKLHVFANVCEKLSTGTDVELKVDDAVQHLVSYSYEHFANAYPFPIE